VRIALAALVLAMTLPAAGAAETPKLDLLSFFEGRTRGVGVLDPLIGKTRRFEVASVGVPQADGSLVVTQLIRWADGDTDERTWRMRRTGANTFEGEVSDGKGAARGVSTGASGRLSYVLDKGPGVRMEHRMMLQPDGRTVVQQVRASVFGLPAASLSETITREP